MKKLVSLLLVLCMVLGCAAALAEAKTEYNVEVLVWKFDDTYGSSVRQGMTKWAELVGEELGTKINLTMYDAADDMAKQVEQANILVGDLFELFENCIAADQAARLSHLSEA